eukprot:365429-Chlamydomonas_euryale.AAC.16
MAAVRPRLKGTATAANGGGLRRRRGPRPSASLPKHATLDDDTARITRRRVHTLRAQCTWSRGAAPATRPCRSRRLLSDSSDGEAHSDGEPGGAVSGGGVADNEVQCALPCPEAALTVAAGVRSHPGTLPSTQVCRCGQQPRRTSVGVGWTKLEGSVAAQVHNPTPVRSHVAPIDGTVLLGCIRRRVPHIVMRTTVDLAVPCMLMWQCRAQECRGGCCLLHVISMMPWSLCVVCPQMHFQSEARFAVIWGTLTGVSMPHMVRVSEKSYRERAHEGYARVEHSKIEGSKGRVDAVTQGASHRPRTVRSSARRVFASVGRIHMAEVA